MSIGSSSKAGSREWIGLAVLALPCLLYSMDLTVLNLAVPHLSADLQPTSAQLLWIVDIYGFLVAGSLITMGTLGDRIGRRRLLLIGAGAFGAASVLAAFSFTAEMLIVARALLGVAAATLAPSTLSLIRNMFLDPKERTFAIGVWIASFSTGGAIGPLFGGFMLEHFWWGSVFLLNVPVMILLLILGPLLLPEFRDARAGRMDLVSAAMSLGAVLLVIYGVKSFAAGTEFLTPALAIAAGLGIGFAFVRRQQVLADPLIDLSLFHYPGFGAALLVNVVGVFIAFGTFLFVAQYLQLVLGMGPLEAGLWTMPSGIAFVAGSMLTPLIAARMPPIRVIAFGFAFTALGFAALTQIGGPHALLAVVAGFVILSLGLAPVFTMTTDLILGAAPPERAGIASGLSETGAELGGALGIAVLGSLVTAIYRGLMETAVPAGVPAIAAGAARETLGGVSVLVETLPAETGAALLAVARSSFTDAVIAVSALSATLALAAAIIAAAWLRGASPAPPPAAAAAE